MNDPRHDFVENRCRCFTYNASDMGINPEKLRGVTEHKIRNGAGAPLLTWINLNPSKDERPHVL